MAKSANTTGIVIPVPSPMPLNSPSRPGWPSLKMTTPTAPAAWALRALSTKSHAPRCTRATAPAGNPTKSSGSHPLSELGSGVGGIVTSTGTTGPVPVPRPPVGAKALTVTSASSLSSTSVSVDWSSVYRKSNGWTVTS